MNSFLAALERLGGLGSRRELIEQKVSDLDIDFAVRWVYAGSRVIRVRKGWYAAKAEHPEVLRAWRVGGRLTCISALAFHQRTGAPRALHIEVPANAARLRDPRNGRLPLGADAAVVVHWARDPGPGDRRSVTPEHAEAVAAACGVHSGPVRTRAARGSVAQAAARLSESRMV